MSSGAKNKRDGARYESDLVKHLRQEGFDTERLRLSGKEDEGDVILRTGDPDKRVVIEAKAGKNLRVRHWFDEEAVPEAKNYAMRRELLIEGAVPALVMKSHGKNIRESLVTIRLEDFVTLLKEQE